jgi:hypothetical protein
VGIVWPNDPDSYAGGSVATGRVSHAGQIKGDDQAEKKYPGLTGWQLGVIPTATHRKDIYVDTRSKRSRMEPEKKRSAF